MSGRRLGKQPGRRRNGGFGRDTGFAARNALRASYGIGRYATTTAHRRRFGVIWERFCKPLGWRALEDATPEGLRLVARRLTAAVTRGRYSTAYAHNLLSSLNVVLRAALGPSAPAVSAVQHLGPRTQVRHDPPDGMSHDVISALVSALSAAGEYRAAAVVLLARGFGLRLREALLANIPRLIREARATGFINIQEGTKGGRRAPRWIPVTSLGQAALERAQSVAAGRTNLLGAGDSLIGAVRGDVRRARKILSAHGIRKFHDLRAAYGCERYEQITGHAAPVLGGPRPPRDVDQAARRQVATELGHGRTQIAGAYIGGWRK